MDEAERGSKFNSMAAAGTSRISGSPKQAALSTIIRGGKWNMPTLMLKETIPYSFPALLTSPLIS